MDLGFGKFDKERAQPLQIPPDFAVLLAGLSARQATSPTVRLQVTIADGGTVATADAALVNLFAEGEKPDSATTAGRFSALTARSDK